MSPKNRLEYSVKTVQTLATATLLALIVLCLGWEAVWAPLHPKGSWLLLKALPLLLPLRGILHGRRYTFQWSTLLIFLYLTEGMVRGWSDTGWSQKLAWLEVGLSVLFFVLAVLFVRLSRQPVRQSGVETLANESRQSPRESG